MCLQNKIFENEPAAFKNMKFFGSAFFLLVWLAVGAAAQANPATDKSLTAQTEQTAPPVLPISEQTDAARPLTLHEAIAAALGQASNFKSAQIGEQIAAQEVRQAKAALYPRIAANPAVIYTSPSFGNSPSGVPRPPSFLGANAITEYQSVVNAAGEIDTSGRLRATLERNKLLVEAARAGSEIAKRDLIGAVTEAYFNLALATLRRRGAELNWQSAQAFENNLKLQLDAGEIAPVDSVRARLQSSTRGDELEQTRAGEAVNADALRVLVGSDFTKPIAAEDLLVQTPASGEIENYTQTMIEMRPEFVQFEAERRAAELDVKIAKSERRPQITYSVNGGFITDSLSPGRLKNSLGIQPTVGVSIPLFDWGASRSREAQAKLRLAQAANNRELATRQFANAFFTARTQALSAASRIRQIAASITDAELNVAASAARYRAGEASIIEVTDANNTLVSQRQALYQAIFDYQTARARLLRAIGQ